jgi:hypothetical protein
MIWLTVRSQSVQVEGTQRRELTFSGMGFGNSKRRDEFEQKETYQGLSAFHIDYHQDNSSYS